MDLYKDGGLHVLAKINSLIDSYKTPAAGYLIFMRCWELQMLDLIHVWSEQRAMGIQYMAEVGVPVTRDCDRTSFLDRAGILPDFAVIVDSCMLVVSVL